jgi:hypothetical protein
VTEDRYPQVRTLRDVAAFRDRHDLLKCALPVDTVVAPDGPLSSALRIGDRELANRWAVLPMEGWDGTLHGAPTELVARRWRRFGQSGAALIWVARPSLSATTAAPTRASFASGRTRSAAWPSFGRT